MFLMILILLGVLLAFGGLLALWNIPDSTLGPGPKTFMILSFMSVIVFVVWLVLFAPRIAAGP